MDRLTPDQAAKVGDAPGPAGRYLGGLIERMDHTPARNGDPKLYRLVRAAEDARHAPVGRVALPGLRARGRAAADGWGLRILRIPCPVPGHA